MPNPPKRGSQGLARQVATALVSIGLPVVVAIASMFIVDHIVFLKAADWFVKDIEIASLTAAEAQDPDIVIVKIDEDTLRRFTYREPIDRTFLSDLLQKIVSLHPRAIGLDVLFDQKTEPSKDAELLRTLRSIPVPMVVTISDVSDLMDEQQFAFQDAYVPAHMRVLPTLAADQTDTVRWIFPGQTLSRYGYVPGFARALARDLGMGATILDDRTCGSECLEIAWHGSPAPEVGAFRTIPAQDLLDPQFAALGHLIRNKVVLIGTVVSINDLHRTPFAALDARKGVVPGVVVHAHALAQLLRGTSPHLAGWGGNFLVALLFSFFGAALGVWNRTLLVRSIGGIVGLASLWAIGFALFHFSLLSIGLLAPSIAAIGSFGVVDALTGGQARRQREFIHNAFSHYVSPKLVERLERDPENLSLEGERRIMTYLFSDIESFTTLSETMDSKDLARLLNRYFDGVTQCVLKYDGMIDKFIGDSVFAIFNAPIDLADHAACAVGCAIEMDRFASQFSREQKALGVPFGITRIGVHTGPGVVGNFGSSTRFNYTATGDSVNLASRLEGLNKYFHTRMAVSETSKDLCPDIAFRPLGDIVVKGRAEPIEVWQPLESGADSGFALRYRKAYDAMKEEDPSACEMFAALASERPEDSLVKVHYERLRRGERGATIVMAEK
jgi:class 3 adenylate cyclase/CHASE2 domain-containing sensor protein